MRIKILSQAFWKSFINTVNNTNRCNTTLWTFLHSIGQMIFEILFNFIGFSSWIYMDLYSLQQWDLIICYQNSYKQIKELILSCSFFLNEVKIIYEFWGTYMPNVFVSISLNALIDHQLLIRSIWNSLLSICAELLRKNMNMQLCVDNSNFTVIQPDHSH